MLAIEHQRKQPKPRLPVRRSLLDIVHDQLKLAGCKAIRFERDFKDVRVTYARNGRWFRSDGRIGRHPDTGVADMWPDPLNGHDVTPTPFETAIMRGLAARHRARRRDLKIRRRIREIEVWSKGGGRFIAYITLHEDRLYTGPNGPEPEPDTEFDLNDPGSFDQLDQDIEERAARRQKS